MNHAPKKLSERKASFASFYAAGHSGAESARLAGYAPSSARQAACRLLSEPLVQDAIDDALQALEAKDKVKLLHDLEQGWQMAIETKDAAAVVHAVEIKAKLAGAI